MLIKVVFHRDVGCFSPLEACMELYGTIEASSQEETFSSVQVQELLDPISEVCGVFSIKKTRYSLITNLLSYQFRLQDSFERVRLLSISFIFLSCHLFAFHPFYFIFEAGSHLNLLRFSRKYLIMSFVASVWALTSLRFE